MVYRRHWNTAHSEFRNKPSQSASGHRIGGAHIAARMPAPNLDPVAARRQTASGQFDRRKCHGRIIRHFGGQITLGMDRFQAARNGGAADSGKGFWPIACPTEFPSASTHFPRERACRQSRCQSRSNRIVQVPMAERLSLSSARKVSVYRIIRAENRSPTVNGVSPACVVFSRRCL